MSEGWDDKHIVPDTPPSRGSTTYTPQGEEPGMLVIQIDRITTSDPWLVWIWNREGLRWESYILHKDATLDEAKAWAIATWRMT